MIALALEEQILGAPVNCVDASADDSLPKLGIDRPPKPSMAHDDIGNHARSQVRFYATARDFDFWKLGHEEAVATR